MFLTKRTDTVRKEDILLKNVLETNRVTKRERKAKNRLIEGIEEFRINRGNVKQKENDGER